MTLHKVHAGPLPADKLVLHIKLADGSIWAVLGLQVLDDLQAFYGREGWYADQEEDAQPTGDDLRGLIEANIEWEHAALEIHWADLAAHAQCVAGASAPPSDRLWAVAESGGSLEMLTTLTQAEQLGIAYGWRDVEEVPRAAEQ
jgi:hypothetical protein